MFFVLVEIAVIALLLLLGVSQILIPTINGTPWFPALRRRKIHGEIKQANDAIESERLAIEAELAKLRAKALREERIKHQAEEEFGDQK